MKLDRRTVVGLLAAVAALGLVGAGNALAGPTFQDFDGTAPNTPYTISNVGGGADPAVMGAGDQFLRMLYQTGSERKFVAFDQTEVGTGYNKIKIDWDFRPINTGTGDFGDGYSFGLLNVANYGATGAAPTGDGDPERWELSGGNSLTVSFDMYPGGQDGMKEVRFYQNGVERAYADSPVDTSHGVPGGDPNTQPWDHAQVIVTFPSGINVAQAKLYLGGDTTEGSGTKVLDATLPAMSNFENRAAFGARTGGAVNYLDLNNVGVQYSTDPTVKAFLPATFRVDCDDLNTMYVSDSDTVTGTAVTGTNWTNTGTAQLPLNEAQYIHIHGHDNGGGYWMAASLSAPAGYQFAETGGRYLATTADATKQPLRALWSASPVPWEDASYVPWDPNTSPSPPRDMGWDEGSHPTPTRAIWNQVPDPSALDDVYFSTRATLQEAPPLVISGTPVGSIDTSLTGFTTRIVQSSTGVGDLGTAEGRLGLSPGDANHYMSQLTVVNRADIHAGSGGAFGANAGFLAPGRSAGGAGPENTAAIMAGYIHATAGETRSFAVGSSDGYRLKIGDTVVWDYLNGRGMPAQHDTVPVTFPSTGYYPVEVTYYNGGGDGGLEVSSAAGVLRTFDWTAAGFRVLGDTGAGGIQVYQRSGGVSPNATGANSVGNPVHPLASLTIVDPSKMGLRVQQAYPGGSMGDVSQSKAFFADPANNNVGVIGAYGTLHFRDPEDGSTGNFPGVQPFPINDLDAGYNPVAPKNDENFVTRMNGVIHIPSAGTYSFACGTDDSFSLRVGDVILGEFAGGRGQPGGRSNFMYGYFPQAGLYPVEFYHHEGGGGSSVELAHGLAGGPTQLIVSSMNPSQVGFSTDWSGVAFQVEPVARLKGVGTNMTGAAYANVPALGLEIPPEKWTLSKVVQNGQPRVAGLLGQYYDYSSNTGDAWNDSQTPVGTRDDFQSGNFNMGDNFGYGPWGNMEDQFGVRWTGYMNVPQTGRYSFHMATDDVSWIFIDTDGDGICEPAPTNGAWDAWWNDVDLIAGMHKVEFRAREYGGGEWSWLQWMLEDGFGWQEVPGDLLSQDLFDGSLLPLDFGTGQIGGPTWEDLMAGMFENGVTYRLTTQIAGLSSSADGRLGEVPEPLSMALLAAGLTGLGGYVRRRRRA